MRRCAIAFMLPGLLALGCGHDVSVRKEVSRGQTRVLERPVDANAPVSMNTVADATSATVTLLPSQCVTVSETPVVTTVVTEKTSRWTNSLGWLGAAGAWAALGAVSWAGVGDRPHECPPDDEECRTKGEARAAAYVCWGLGAAFGGYRVYAGIPKTETTRSEGTETLDRQTSAHGPCRQSIAGVPIELRLPNGQKLTVLSDGSGVARFELSSSALEGLARSAAAVVFVSGSERGRVELSQAVADYQRKSGRRVTPLVSSTVMGASGRLFAQEAQVEVMLSPQDASGGFVGDFLTRGEFEFRNVTATPVTGGDAIPLELEVTGVDASMPKRTGESAIVVFDSSGSMRENDPGRSGRLRAAEAFLDAIKPTTDVALLDFGMGASAGFSVSRVLSEFTSDRVALKQSLGKLGESGGTPLYESLGDALALYERSNRAGPVLLLTDGQARRIGAVMHQAIAAGIPVYAVGLGRQLDFDNLRSLGLETGGFFVEASESSDLEKAFKGIALGVSVGRVRVFGAGATTRELPQGVYSVRGEVAAKDPSSSGGVVSPFAFTGRVTGSR